MRIIKFRSWDKERGMVYGIDIINPLRNYKLMQYTGLKDKNGKEVWEGDVLEVDGNERIVKVVWHEHAGMWDTDVISVNEKEKAFASLKNYEWRLRTKVIGNIYELYNQ